MCAHRPPLLSPALLSLGLWASAFATPSTALADTIRLSDSLDAVRAGLSAPSSRGAHALVIDASRIDHAGALKILKSLQTLRRAGGSVVAVCPAPAAGAVEGSAIVAMACDAVVFVKGGEIAGASPAWCSGETDRATLVQELEGISRLDPLLNTRLVDATEALSWTPKTGFKADTTGAVKLASAGQPIKLGAAQLKRVQVAAQEFATLEEAIEAIEGGNVDAREDPSSAPPPSSPGSPPGSPPRRPPGNPPANPPSTAPTVPPAPAAPNAEIEAKLAPKVREYGQELAKLQGLLKEFDDYFYGREGVWTTQHKSLKAVWFNEADNTRDANTKTRTERLQRDMKTAMSAMTSLAKSIDKIAKNPEHPEVLRTKSHQETIAGLRAAFERNKVSNYEEFSKKVLQLK